MFPVSNIVVEDIKCSNLNGDRYIDGVDGDEDIVCSENNNIPTSHKDFASWIKADCSNPRWIGKIGIVQDLRRALQRRNQLGVEKMVVVVPRDYFTYHREKGNILGAVLRYARSYKLFGFSLGKRIPSHHIAFVLENQYNNGVIAHEIGHTLGQVVEFYLDNDRKIYPYCKTLGVSNKNCKEYEIEKSFTHTSNRKGILENQHTIMSNVGNRKGLNKLGIDRDTYQKNFNYLLKPNKDLDQEDKGSLIDRWLGIRTDIVTFSGVHSQDEQRFITANDIYEEELGRFTIVDDIDSDYWEKRRGYIKVKEIAPIVEGSKSGFATEHFQKGNLLIHLELNGEIVSSVRVATDLELEFPSSEGGETQALKNVPIVASLPVPDGLYGNKELQLVVIGYDKELFRQLVTKWKE